MRRTKQIPVALPDAVRRYYEQHATESGIPLATILRMTLIRAMRADSATGDTRPSVADDTPEDSRTLSFGDE
jgi:hypothetical protein